MVKAVLVVLQTLLFLLIFAAGSFLLPFFPALPVWQVQAGPHRFFVLDGIVFAIAVYLLIVLIEAARKRLRGAAGLTTLALLLALILGFAMNFGFKSV